MATQRTRAELREAYYSDNIIYKDLYLDLVESLWNLQDDGAASGTTPLVYVALVTQDLVAPPDVTELENTIGNIIWTRNDVGQYIGSLVGGFPDGKTFCYPPSGSGNIFGSAGIFQLFRFTDDAIHLFCYGQNTGNNRLELMDYNNALPMSIRIEIYP